MKTTLNIGDDAATVLEQNRENREKTIRDLAGWLSHEEGAELGESVKVFDQIHEGDGA